MNTIKDLIHYMKDFADDWHGLQWTSDDQETLESFAAQHADMLTMLGELEWEGNDEGFVCPLCRSPKLPGGGHSADCKLGNLLKRIKEGG